MRALDRRAFLHGSLLAASALGGACGTSSNNGAVLAGGAAGAGGAGAGGATAGSAATFSIWRELQVALRASPDHFVARADDVVATKDPAAIHAFVRDVIITQPPVSSDVADRYVRWGVTTTLRGGAGTPREKAELLVELYRRAGMTATVVSGPLSLAVGKGAAAARAVFLRSYDRPFAPAIDAARLTAWQTQLGSDATNGPKAVDVDAREQAAIAAAVTAVLPSSVSALTGNEKPTPEAYGDVYFPLVAVTVNGANTYANPLVPKAVFGQAYTLVEPQAARDATTPPMVDVTLAMATTRDATKRTTLVQKSYAIDDLIGHTLAAQLAPATSFDKLLGLRPADIHSFVPVLAVHGADLDDAKRASLAALGPMVTLSGSVVTVDADGTQRVDGNAVAPAGAVDPAAAARVAKLRVTAHAEAYPHIVLDVSASDANGAPVAGLGASAFAVKEAGPIGFLLQHTPSTPMRVALVIDADDPLDTGETTNALAEALTKAVAAFAPDAAVIVVGAPGSPALRDPSAVVAALVGNDDADDCWALLAKANALNPTVILMAGDFYPGYPPSAGWRAVIAAGAPVVAVGITGKTPGSTPTLPPDFDAVVALSHGVGQPSGGVAEAVAAVIKIATERRNAGTYRLTYTAPAAGPTTRPVSVAVASSANGAAMAATTYEVPAATGEGTTLAISGLYLTVTIGDRTVTRTLCGDRSSTHAAGGSSVNQTTIDDARGGCFGVAVLSIEGVAPSPSERLDEELRYKLALEPLAQALLAKDAAAVRDHLPRLGDMFPPVLRALQAPLGLASTDAITYETGPRAVLLVAQPRFNQGVLVRADVLPLTRFATFADDAVVSYKTTLAQTARIAVLEHHAFATSTAVNLAGAALSLFDEGDVDPVSFAFLPPDQQAIAATAFNYYSDAHRFLPRTAPFQGFWAADTHTGTLLGVLPDGSGGGATSSACQMLGDLQKLGDILALLASVAGVAGLGPFFALGKAVEAVAIAASIILDNIGDPDFTYDPDEVIQSLAQNTACNIAKSVLGEAAAANDIANRAAQIESAAGIANASPFGCPSKKTALTC